MRDRAAAANNTEHPQRTVPKNTRLLVLAAVMLVIPVVTMSAFAQEEIDPRSGQLALWEVDLEIAAGPITLDVARMYQPGGGVPGLLGDGWRLNWESTLHGSPPEVVLLTGLGAVAFEAADDHEGLVSSSGDRLLFLEGGRILHHTLDGVTFVFEQAEATGRLVEVVHPNDNRVVLTYGNDGHLRRVDGPFGSFLQLAVNNDGLVTEIASSFGSKVEYRYVGELLTEVYVDGVLLEQYAYGEDGQLVRIDRSATGAVELGYDDERRVISRRWADGSEETYHYDTTARTTRLTHATGGITGYQWSEDGLREEITDPLGHTTITEFDSSFRPEAVTDPAGEKTRYRYDDLGRLVEAVDGEGRPTRYEHRDRSNLVTSIHHPDGLVESFEYDDRGNLLAERVDEQVVRSFTYFPNGLVQSVRGLGQPELNLAYYPDGLLRSQTDPLDRTTTFEYDGRGNLVALTDPGGRKTRWDYDAQNRLIRETDATGASNTYGYDDRSLLVGITDPVGAATGFEYDLMGRLVAETDPIGRTTRFTYGPSDQLATVTDPVGHTSHLSYDAAGRLVREVDFMGGETTYSYSPADRVSSITLPSGGRWQFEELPDGTVSVVDPGGGISRNRYDPATRREAGTSTLGEEGWREFDSMGRIVGIGGAEDDTIRFQYDENGYLVALSSPRGPILTAEVDRLGRTSLARTGTGYEVRYRFNASGNLVATEDNAGTTTEMVYDEAGRLVGWTDAEGGTTRYDYDPAGRPRRLTDPAGQVTRLEYNVAGELTRAHGPTGATVALEYDEGGGIRSLRSPDGGVTRIFSDAVGNPVRVANPLGGESRSVYDTAGRLIRRTDADGHTTSFSFDDVGRMTLRTTSDGRRVRYAYDAAGNPVEVDDDSFPIRYAYDEAGRLTRIEYPAIQKSIGYVYDDQGRLAEFDDWEGRRYRYSFDHFERLDAVTLPDGGAFSFTNDDQDRLIGITYPNNVTKEIVYDSLDRVASIAIRDPVGEPVAGWSYTYDGGSNLTHIRDIQGRETTYSYDAAGRLTAEDGPAGSFSYSYSPGGNRLSAADGERTIEYRYNAADQLISAGDESFAHDGRGNLVERHGPEGVTRYEFDGDNRLIRVALPDGETAKYGYGPTGDRIWREDGSGRTWLLTDGRNLLAELDEQLEEERRFWHGPGLDNPLVMWRGGEPLYYHTDMMGSVAALTSSSGAVEASYLIDAFGTVRDSTGSVANPFVFTAREHDSATGLYDYRARVYDPGLGRFLSPDPIWRSPLDPEGASRYAYVRNTPTRYSDPTGLDILQDALDYDPFNKKFQQSPESDVYWHRRWQRGWELRPASDPHYDLHAPGHTLDEGGWMVPRTPEFIRATKPARLQLSDKQWLRLCNNEIRNSAKANPVLARDNPEHLKRFALRDLRLKIKEAPAGAPPNKVVSYVRMRQRGLLKGPQDYPAHWSERQIRSAMDQAARSKLKLGPPPPTARERAAVVRGTPTRSNIDMDEFGPRPRSGPNTVTLEAPGSNTGTGGASGSGSGTGSGAVARSQSPSPSSAGGGGAAIPPGARWNPKYKPRPLSTTRGPWGPVRPKVPTGWERFTKAPTAGQTGMLTILLTAETIARCRTRGLTAGECAQEVLPGFLILAGTVAVCIKAPALGVVVIVGGTALAVHKGVTDVLEMGYTWWDKRQAEENLKRIEEERRKWTEGNIKNKYTEEMLRLERRIRETGEAVRDGCARLANTAYVVENGAKLAEAELAKRPSAATINAGSDACRAIPDKEARLRAIQEEIGPLIDQLKTDADTAWRLADACRTTQDAVKLRALIKGNLATGQKIERLAAAAERIREGLEDDRATIDDAKNALRQAMDLRDLLTIAADRMPPLEATDAEARRTEAAIDLLTDPPPSLGNDIKNLIKAFGDYDTLSLEMVADFEELRQQVRDLQPLAAQCRPADFPSRHRVAADRIVTAKLKAQSLIDQVDAVPLENCSIEPARAVAREISKFADAAEGSRKFNQEARKEAERCFNKHGLSATGSGSGTDPGGSGGAKKEPPPLVGASGGGSKGGGGGGGGGGGRPPVVDASRPGGSKTGGDASKQPGGDPSKSDPARPGDDELVYANVDIELAQDDYGIYDILDNIQDAEIIIRTPQGEKQFFGAHAVTYLKIKGWIVYKERVGWVATDRLKRFLGLGETGPGAGGKKPDKPEGEKRPSLGGMTFDGPLEEFNPNDPTTPEGKRKILHDLRRQCLATPEWGTFWGCIWSCWGDECRDACTGAFEQSEPQVCRDADALAAQLGEDR